MTTMYLGARYSRKGELLGYKERLEELGHHVTSRWLTFEPDLSEMATDGSSAVAPHLRSTWAQNDVEDVLRAEWNVNFTEHPDLPAPGRSRGGRHVEFGLGLGLALSRNCRLILIGPRENIFHHLDIPHLQQWLTFDAWFEALVAQRLEEKGDRFGSGAATKLNLGYV